MCKGFLTPIFYNKIPMKDTCFLDKLMNNNNAAGAGWSALLVRPGECGCCEACEIGSCKCTSSLISTVYDVINMSFDDSLYTSKIFLFHCIVGVQTIHYTMLNMDTIFSIYMADQ